jgi:hypothetical protein
MENRLHNLFYTLFDEGPYAVVLDKANHTSAGFISQSIVWLSGIGSDHAWIGVR